VFEYERPDANDEYDANWLRARCSVTVAEFSAVLSLALVTMTSPDSRMNWNKPSSYSRGQLPSQLSRQDLQLRLNLRLLATLKSSEAQGHKRQMCRTCRYSHSHSKLTNHSLRTPCVTSKRSCLDSRSGAANRTSSLEQPKIANLRTTEPSSFPGRLLLFTRTENLERRLSSQSAVAPDCETPAASPSDETARTFLPCRSA
jgi:hypothetical protein